MDPDHPLRNYYIEERIPNGFILKGGVKTIPPISNIKYDFDNETHMLKISCGYLPSMSDIRYVMTTNISGKDFCLGPASLKAVRNIGSKTVKIQLPSNIFYINVANNPPQFRNWSVPKSRLYHGDMNLLASAEVFDLDGDPIRCNLTSSISGPIPLNKNESNNSTYIWDLSSCNRGTHELIFTASDNKDITTIRATVEIWEKSLGFLAFPTEFTWFAIIALLGGTIGCAVCRIFCRQISKIIKRLNNCKYDTNKLTDSAPHTADSPLCLKPSMVYIYRSQRYPSTNRYRHNIYKVKLRRRTPQQAAVHPRRCRMKV